MTSDSYFDDLADELLTAEVNHIKHVYATDDKSDKDYGAIMDLLKDGVADRALEIFKQAIQTHVYDFYKPNWYPRTNQLIDNAITKFESWDTIYLTFDYESMVYHSKYPPQTVDARKVVDWVNNGHHHPHYTTPEFHQYDGRNFLEYAEEAIENEFNADDSEVIVIYE